MAVDNGNWFSNQAEVSDKIQNLDSSGNLTGTVTGNVTGNLDGNIATTAETAPAGAGLTGTSPFGAPEKYQYVENGVIVTTYKVDVTGLASVATANDAIGLSAGGNAYLDQYTVADQGVIFRAEFACIETPAGGDNDLNVVLNASGTIAYDGAAGTTYVVNGGDQAAGQVVVNNTLAATANHYMYLTAGTGDTAAAYTAGMFILKLYGHALLA